MKFSEDREPWLLVFRDSHLKRDILVLGVGEANLIDMCQQGQAEGNSTVCTGNAEEGGE